MAHLVCVGAMMGSAWQIRSIGGILSGILNSYWYGIECYDIESLLGADPTFAISKNCQKQGEINEQMTVFD
jgi:hypothetical protein